MIDYTDAIDDLAPGDLVGFFEGWPDPPDPTTHLRLLRGSTHAIIAVDRAEEVVAGFITAHSDGILSAYIPLLEVLPTHRGRGIGSELVRRMLARLGHLYMVDLTCDPDVQPFYGRLGLRPSHGMVIRNFDRQSGVAT